MSVDSQELVGGNYAATNALDGNPATFWHTEWYLRTPPCPIRWCSIWGVAIRSMAFAICPAKMATPTAPLPAIQFYVSDDGTTWGTAVAAGTLAANTAEKTVRFTAKTGRYVRLVALSEIRGNPPGPVPLNSTSLARPPRPRRQRRVVS